MQNYIFLGNKYVSKWLRFANRMIFVELLWLKKSANIWICNFVIANCGVFEDSGVMVIKYETRVRHRLMTHPLPLSFISYFLSQNRELIPPSHRSKDRPWQICPSPAILLESAPSITTCHFLSIYIIIRWYSIYLKAKKFLSPR